MQDNTLEPRSFRTPNGTIYRLSRHSGGWRCASGARELFGALDANRAATVLRRALAAGYLTADASPRAPR